MHLVSVAVLHYKTHNLPIAVELAYFNSALKYNNFFLYKIYYFGCRLKPRKQLVCVRLNAAIDVTNMPVSTSAKYSVMVIFTFMI